MSDPRLLLLMRHARPEPSGAGPDLARELSAAGWMQARRIGERLRDEPPLLVLSSPATRCRQTAEGVLAGLAAAPAPEILVRPELGEEDAAGLLGEIEHAAGRLLVVSHQPTIVSLGIALLGRAGLPLDLRPAQVAVLAGEPGAWRLREMLEAPSVG